MGSVRQAKKDFSAAPRARGKTIRRPPGRPPGVPNKNTAEVREVFRAVFDRLAPKAEEWITAAARQNPAKGADLLLRLAQHFVPTLARSELVGAGGEPLRIEVVSLAPLPSPAPRVLQMPAAGLQAGSGEEVPS